MKYDLWTRIIDQWSAYNEEEFVLVKKSCDLAKCKSLVVIIITYSSLHVFRFKKKQRSQWPWIVTDW